MAASPPDLKRKVGREVTPLELWRHSVSCFQSKSRTQPIGGQSPASAVFRQRRPIGAGEMDRRGVREGVSGSRNRSHRSTSSRRDRSWMEPKAWALLVQMFENPSEGFGLAHA